MHEYQVEAQIHQVQDIAMRMPDDRSHFDCPDALDAKQGPWRYLSLFGCAVALVFVWCVILPRVEKIPTVHRHIQAMEDADINVGAMFYSELNWESPTGAAWR